MNTTLAATESQPTPEPLQMQGAEVGISALGALIDTLEWPDGVRRTGIRQGRVWTGRHNRLTVEHRVSFEKDGIPLEYPVQGVIAKTPPSRGVLRNAPQVENNVAMGFYLEDRAASCWLTSPDCDPELPAGRDVFEPRGLQRVLTEAQQNGAISASAKLPGPENPALKLISYRVGRRFVLHLQAPDRSCAGLFVKGFRRKPGLPSIQRASELGDLLATRSNGLIRVPSFLGVIADSNLLVFSEIWPAPVQTDYRAIDVSVAARVASYIHRLPRGDDRLHSASDELNTVERWQQAIHVLRPECLARLQAILSTLRASQPSSSPESYRAIHRDYYHSQLLRNDEAIWLTDWDTLSQGHPELDIATYVAHAVLNDALASLPTHDWTYRLQEFLAEYRASGAIVDLNRLGWYLACALTRMAAMYSARQCPDAAMAPLWRIAGEFAEAPDACLKRLDA